MTKNKQVHQNSSALGSSRAWLICFIASLFFFFEFFQLSSFDPLNSLIQQRYGLNSIQVSWLSSAYLWGNVLFLLPAGILMDKYGPRCSILYSLAIAILGLVCFEYGQSFYLVLFGRFVVGIGNAFCFVALIVLVSQWFLANRQALVMALMVNVGFLGGMSAHTPLVWVLKIYGWSMLMVLNLGMGLMVWLLSYLFVIDGPSFKSGQASEDKLSLASFRQHVLRFQNIAAGSFISCLNLPIMVLCALWGIHYLQEVHHLGSYHAANVVSMIFLGSMLGSPLMGWFSDRIQRRKPIMFLGGLGALLLCLPLCFSAMRFSYLSLMCMFFGLGFFSSAQVLGYPLITESNTLAFAGRATSLASILIMGGAMLGQIGFGALLAKHGAPPLPASYQFAMLLFPSAILFALGLLLPMRETFCKKMMET